MDRIEIINDIEKRIEELEQEMQEGMEFLDKYEDEPSSDLALVELQTKIDILRRVCERAYNETEPKYRWNSYITLKKIADIFGWDWDFSQEKEDE